MGCLVSKVKDTCRINCITHISGFEMQVRSGRTTGITTKCYGITGVYILLRLNKETRQVVSKSLVWRITI